MQDVKRYDIHFTANYTTDSIINVEALYDKILNFLETEFAEDELHVKFRGIGVSIISGRNEHIKENIPEEEKADQDQVES